MTKLTTMKLILIGLFIIGSTFAESVKQVSAADCKEGERFVTCASCEPTCGNQNPMCTMQCRPPQCVCENGKVRHSNGKCVLPAECQATNDTFVPIRPPVLPPPRDNNGTQQQQCGRNEFLNQCSGCPENQCGRPQIMCKMICNNIPKCMCDSGFFRNNQTGQCIAENECPGGSSDGQCKENETLKNCPGCEPSCLTPAPFCPKICKEGQACECSEGFVRNDAGKCVKQIECPKTGNNTCGQNEGLKTCPGCEPTCANPNPICPMICRPGQACQCLAGFVRNEAGKCVQQTQCAASGGNNTKCKENETLKNCPGCEASCSNPNPVCIEICRPGQACECSEGFVRNDAGKCVRQTECGATGNNTVTECAENERLTQCSGCEANCANLDRMCPMVCNMIPKCECASGFARSSESKCVPINQCSNTRNPRDNGTQTPPNQCQGQNEVLTSCPGCEPSCANKNPVCTMACRLGQECQCQKGFYRNTDGKCVKESECNSAQNPPTSSNSSTSCPKNEVFMECGGCEGSCTNHNPICTLQCRPAGCYCPVGKGFVRGPKGHCIHRSLCQKRAINNSDEDEEYNPCAATSCPINSTCEVIKVQCVKAPCPPQARCKLATNSPPNPCASMMCPPNTVCKLNQVQCFTTPCPPIPECQPLNETRPSRSPPVVDKCATMFCTADSTCVDGKCVPLEENRPPRTVSNDKCMVVRCAANTTCVDGKCIPNSQQNPCATVLCPPDTVCKLNHVVCVRAPCPPIPECVPLNETRPSRSPPVDKCAVVRCAANTTCVDGKCIPNSQQNLCLSTLCPPNTVCQLKEVVCIRAPCNPIPECVPINETRPSRSTPIVVPIDPPQQNPCASMLCAANTRCEIVQVNCIQAPCPSHGRCVPLNETQDPTEPLLTCETVDCIQGRVCRMLVTCLDPEKPCPPKPQCVPVTDDLQISDPCATIDCRDGFRCINIRANCVKAPCPVVPVEGRCVPMNETDGETRVTRSVNDVVASDPCATMRCRDGMVCSKILVNCLRTSEGCRPRGVCVPANANGQPQVARPDRAVEPELSPPQNDPCSIIKCSAGHQCAVIMPDCIEGAKDCGPKGVCIPTDPTPRVPEVASMPPARDDPIEENIQNKFCMMARCAHGCITTGIKCNEDGTGCEYLGQCAPENFNESSINVCENSTCGKNKRCEEEIVQCFTRPCLPIPRCINSSPSSNVCENHQCPEGQECKEHRLRCNRLIKNCKAFPTCVNKKQQQQ